MYISLYSIKDNAAGKVSIMARPRGGDWLVDEIQALHEARVNVLVSLLTTDEIRELELEAEAAYCASQEIIYLNFPIVDLSVPAFSSTTFTFLERLTAYLRQGHHVVLHCRQGIGRSGLMAASLLISIGMSAEQALKLLSEARGYTVPETEEQRAWVMAFSKNGG